MVDDLCSVVSACCPCEGLFPRGKQLNKHLERVFDQLRVHVADLLEDKVGEAGEHVSAPLRVVSDQSAQTLQRVHFELVV